MLVWNVNEIGPFGSKITKAHKNGDLIVTKFGRIIELKKMSEDIYLCNLKDSVDGGLYFKNPTRALKNRLGVLENLLKKPIYSELTKEEIEDDIKSVKYNINNKSTNITIDTHIVKTFK